MTAAMRAELRKLLTIRSTYVLIVVAFLFVVLVAFYAKGYKLSAAELRDPHHIADSVIIAGSSLPIVFGSIIAVLLMTHEYRYSTIMYSLTASNSRSKVLGAKFAVISVFALLFMIAICAASAGLAYLGVHLHGHTLVHQIIPYKDLVWRCLFYGWGSVIAGLLIAALIRNQIGAVVALFVIPSLEQAAGLLLKGNAVYLPFMSSDEVLTSPSQGSISHGHAALVFSAYLVVGWIMAWALFLRRDAN
jgi:ABC-2 type transport system permease protein